MFIDFEGIDGSGKTTLSSRLAESLRSRGIGVTHTREGGEFTSIIARALREVTRSAEHLALDEMAEFLLYCAREAQLLDEVIRPALARGDVVIADRFLFSPMAMTVAGRGEEPSRIGPIVEAVAGGLWPDLVIVVDVDPELARLRKKGAELVAGIEPRAPGRKGLAGLGLLARVRSAFLEQARSSPERFVVVENHREGLAQVEERILSIVESRLGSPRPIRRGIRRAAPPPKSEVNRLPAPFDCRGPSRAEDLLASFFAEVRNFAPKDPATAALLLGSSMGQEAEEIRRDLEPLVPAALLRGLGESDTEEALSLRERLAADQPRGVARSLSRLDHPRAWALREALASVRPDEVAASLVGSSSERAWPLREACWQEARRSVLASLAGIDEEPAWALRRRALEEGASADEVAISLAGLDGEEAWRLREAIFSRASLLAQLLSVAGCVAEPAWELRLRWLSKAPSPILKGLFLLDDPRAWELRHLAGAGARESLDSIAGMEGEAAAGLREKLRPFWPARAIRSLPPRGHEDFLWDTVEAYGGHLHVLRAAALHLVGHRRERESP